MQKISKGLIMSIALSCANLSFAAPPIIIADGKTNIDYSGWANYATSLDTCTPNTFNLPDPFQINILLLELQAAQNQNAPSETIQTIGNAIANAVITYTIYGWIQNKCQVNISRIFNPPPGAASSMQPMTVNMSCEFSQNDLAVLAQSAEQIASGKMDQSGQSPSSQIITNSCTIQQQTSS